jgi:hypothetical protein
MESRRESAEGDVIEAFGHEPYLNIYVVWHPRFANGQAIAEQIYSRFDHDVNDPISRGLAIPVYFRSASASTNGGLPLPVPFNRTQHCVIVALISREIVLDDEWVRYVQNLHDEAEKGQGSHRMFPVSMSQSALDSGILETPNFIRYHQFEDSRKTPQLLIWLTHELGRFLGSPRHNNAGVKQSPPPVKIFISHAKQDGLDLAKNLRAAISETPTDNFFDGFDIAPGYDFDKEIEANISNSVLLVLQSDAYSSRPWCRREVLLAKQLQCPIVVVNALEHNERRSFPYLGNVPVIRWAGNNQREVIDLALLEYLRFSYTKHRLDYLVAAQRIPSDAQLFIRPPELLDCRELINCRLSDEEPPKLVLYPDPPLGIEEIDSLSAFCPAARFTTPTMPTVNKFLEQKTIGLSISNSADLVRLGFGEMHLSDAMIEFARHLLARGANIAYGGLFDYGFTRPLSDLVRTHNATGTGQYGPIKNFLSWPYYLQIDPEREAQLSRVSKIIRVSVPPDVVREFGVNEESADKLEGARGRYVAARCLTQMREEMNRSINARLVMGGKVIDYSGTYPGILEESYLALRDSKPLFLVGAFGGCTRAIIDLLLGGHPEALTQKFQEQNTSYAEFVIEYNNQVNAHPGLGLGKVDYEGMTEFFRGKGIKGLNNRLTDAENLSLFEAIDFNEIIHLILIGLSRLTESG